MTVYTHYFHMEEQANVVYLPQRPNGFAIILLSDNDRTVEKNSSIWERHPERHSFLLSLLEEGYTVIASQLFGKHWGSERACEYMEQLHHYLVKKQILNEKFHFFAEGAGALVVLKLLEKRPQLIRSAFLLNPCIYLERIFQEEKQSKLFFKRFIQELSAAHGVEENDVTKEYCQAFIQFEHWVDCAPIHIYHMMADKRFKVASHSRPFEQEFVKKNLPVSLSLYGLGKSFSSFKQPVRSFFKKNEKKL
ncbi:alpha/beta hydrolase [Alkalihalobacillus pseudalcaliphilus]|uniref:alpha/beta hydrolase n=1 Tax=Alkalihalobacillus pseudalcaliphilus TaxID=79884 RepID=UPI00064DD7D9|nr:alpha/beta hydrolase [Alkalihalobacillus pseudalcaliphilus]KMK74773.1 hypothetical protein AB990_20020 [Alkalihalobacillus pseudalcaliphilus]